MGTLERFNLRWDGFEENTKVTLLQSKEESEFFDVTLLCSDGKQVQTNKVILAGGSTFFHKILKENPQQHPVIYLTEVSYQYLMSMLDFLYTGEANIVQKDLNGFLDIAEDLKIKGLTATGVQTNSSPFSPAPLQSQGAADKPCLPRQVAAEACVLSPKITHPHSGISASCEGQVVTKVPYLSTRVSYSHSSVSTTPVRLQGQVAATQSVLSPRRSHPRSEGQVVTEEPASCESQVATEELGLSPRASYSHSATATEECALSPFPNVDSSGLINTVRQDTSNEDNDDTYKVKVEFEECDPAYYNVSYVINDHGEHYIKHVSAIDLEDNAENIGSKIDISVAKVLDGNPVSRPDIQNGSGQSEVNRDEGMRLGSEQEAKPMKAMVKVVNCLENNRYERNEMVVTEAADSGFINEQSIINCGERSEETEDDNVIPEGELDVNDEKCFYCTKTFSKSSELKKHKMTHIGEKQFQCLVCNKVFSALHKLTAHKKTHAYEKKFQCLVCFKRFLESGTLRQHKRIHTGEKPYECLQCFKRFTQLSGLNKHMTSHAVEKLFQCLLCFKKFSRKDTLKLHEMNHNEHAREKPYQCVQCSKKFTRPCLLRDHKMTHTRQTLYSHKKIHIENL